MGSMDAFLECPENMFFSRIIELNRRAFCVSMRATAVQKECDRGNKNGAGDSNCIFVLFILLSVI